MIWKIDGEPVEINNEENIGDALAKIGGERPFAPLAALVGGEILGLNARPRPDSEIRILDITSSQGRSVYERALRFVFLMACQQILGDTRVIVQHSIGEGIYCEIEEPVNGAQIVEVENRMWELVRDDLPFTRFKMQKEEAIEFFNKRGQTDKARLLAYRPLHYFYMYHCGEFTDYFYGVMPPSTGCLHSFGIIPYMHGAVMLMPSSRHPQSVSAFRPRPLFARTFIEAERWAEILECRNIADLNDMIERGQLGDFISINEALQEKSYADIAQQIIEQEKRLILVAGPSSSGKTTSSHRIAVQLKAQGKRPVSISLDNYYRARHETPLDEHGKPDLECLEALDIEHFNENLLELLEGKKVKLPIFDFLLGERSDKHHELHVAEDQPIIVEGIHGLNPKLTTHIDKAYKYKVYVSALTTINLDDHNRFRTTDSRLLRRIVRDYHTRGSSVENTLSMWDSVRRGEERHIFPYQEEADIMFNTSLVYELAILKKHVYPLLLDVPRESPHYWAASRLRKYLNYVKSAENESLVPPTSILREFIGGSAFFEDTHD